MVRTEKDLDLWKSTKNETVLVAAACYHRCRIDRASHFFQSTMQPDSCIYALLPPPPQLDLTCLAASQQCFTAQRAEVFVFSSCFFMLG